MEKSDRQLMIAVIGDSECSEETGRLAYEAGSLIAQKCAVLVTGGYGGVMEEAARGARDSGGLTIGILSGKDRAGMNSAIQIPIVTGMSDARNVIIVRSADGVMAVGGGAGTLSEIGFALKLGVPFVGLRIWKLSHADQSKELSFPVAKTAPEAVDLLFNLIQS